MTDLTSQSVASAEQIFVPVRPVSKTVVDNGGDIICMCFTEQMAAQIAFVINRDAGILSQ